jgi:hypothetical protein
MSTPGPSPTPDDPNEPVEEWRPGTDRDGNEPEEGGDSSTGDDGEYDQEEREEGGTEVSGRGHPGGAGDEDDGSGK